MKESTKNLGLWILILVLFGTSGANLMLAKRLETDLEPVSRITIYEELIEASKIVPVKFYHRDKFEAY